MTVTGVMPVCYRDNIHVYFRDDVYYRCVCGGGGGGVVRGCSCPLH